MEYVEQRQDSFHLESDEQIAVENTRLNSEIPEFQQSMMNKNEAIAHWRQWDSTNRIWYIDVPTMACKV